MLNEFLIIILIIFSLFAVIYLSYNDDVNDKKECDGQIFCGENTTWNGSQCIGNDKQCPSYEDLSVCKNCYLWKVYNVQNELISEGDYYLNLTYPFTSENVKPALIPLQQKEEDFIPIKVKDFIYVFDENELKYTFYYEDKMLFDLKAICPNCQTKGILEDLLTSF